MNLSRVVTEATGFTQWVRILAPKEVEMLPDGLQIWMLTTGMKSFPAFPQLVIVIWPTWWMYVNKSINELLSGEKIPHVEVILQHDG